jgi:hypothetical protein
MGKPESKAENSKPEGIPVRADVSPGRRRTMRLKISADGAPEFKSLPKEQRDSWKQILSSPDTQAQLGIETKPESSQPPPTLSKEETEILWDVIMGGSAFVYSSMTKAPRAIVARAFALDELDKQLLVTPTQKVIGKYLPEAMSKYGAEIGLLLVFSMVMRSKIALAKAEVAKFEAAEKSAKAGAGREVRPAQKISEPLTIPIPKVREAGESYA